MEYNPPWSPQVQKPEIKENILLAPYTVFKIGGPARFFCEVKDKEDLAEAFLLAKEKSLPVFVFGAGSNVLISDEGFAGLVIKMNLVGLAADGLKIVASTGVSMARAVNFAAENNLGGFEWGVGIPGTVGGSIFGNAGCFGGEIKDVVDSVEIFDGESFKNLRNFECGFAYRDSVFKKHLDWIIVKAALNLKKVDSAESRKKILEYSQGRVLEKTQASGNKGVQEIGAQCAGCIFRNPKADLAAGFLIDTAGLKGKKIGEAMVSAKHANFIINTGSATARDVRALISLVKGEVQKKHGVLLEEEIRII